MVHLVGFTIEIYYDARPCEHQMFVSVSYVFVVSNLLVFLPHLWCHACWCFFCICPQ